MEKSDKFGNSMGRKHMIFYYLCSKTASKLTRFITELWIPKFCRSFIFTLFSKTFGINIDEAEHPLTTYTSFDSFFTRNLKEGCRPVNEDSTIISSPVDALLLETGVITKQSLIQAKGLNYSLSELCPNMDMSSFENGSFSTLYLSPKDCHNIYAPMNGSLTQITHVPGKLYPVREPYISNFKNLYTKNERLNLYFDTPQGKVVVVLVGAFNVGTMSTPLDSEWSTNSFTLTVKTKLYSQINVKKGDKIGTFHLGSTVVLLTEKQTRFCVKRLSLVQMGMDLSQFY